jgi:hypothetical protein
MKENILSLAIVLCGYGSYAQVYDTGNSVGIGNPSPGYKLDVNGNGNYSSFLQIGGAAVNSNTTKLFINNGGGYGKNWALSSGANMISEQGFYIYNWSDSPASPLFTISNGGNVGIGTTNPASKFDIYGNNERFHIGTSNGDLAIGQWDAVTNRIESSGRSLYFTTYAGAINFGISGNTSLSVANSGNVLIGQTTQANSAYKLDVWSKVRANEIVVNTSGADFVFDKEYSLPQVIRYKSIYQRKSSSPRNTICQRNAGQWS